MVNGFDRSRIDELPPRTRTQVESRDRLLGPGYRLFYEDPVEIVRGEGTLLFDADGNDYLDVYNNVASVGHCHPYVVDAVHRQLTTLNTNTRYIQQSILSYSEQFLGTMPAEIGHVMYTCTGSEANDLAMRVARYHTGNRGIIVTTGAYHGLTSDVSAFSPSLGIGVPLGPHVRTISAPDRLRHGGDENVIAAMRREIQEAIADLERHGFGVAAFIADMIFSSDGIYADPAGFLQPIIEEVHNAGGLFIADEVQPGFGRTGQHWWGFQRHNLVPDIMTTGKPMGNGIPVAAAAFRPELLVEFGRNIRYFNTYGGNSVSIAAAQAVLDVIINEGLIANAEAVGGYIQAEIRKLAAPYEQIAEVRGAGLFVGVDIVTDRESNTPDGGAALRMVNHMRRRRVLISASGPRGSVLKVRPPLPFSISDADRMLENFEVVLAEELR
ncbi:aspartate aminotransferase family protein [Mycobacterium sp. SMC-4]|uniref:aspartate aminotransferase family protein n=1 Tax=Mycobacterium sp. SMC-4 TaxID=2857059 RepID=UPI0021B29CBE|nr:aspartate aminotransferase family protein [Mycobacterium sp. SMC-4]UXA21050.1 aspartate aminotransferase family protein [Mycobacterium sp. SMC-4]